MNRILIIALAILTAIFMFSCKGDIGPAGTDGPGGTDVVTVEFQYASLPSAGYTSADTKDAGVDSDSPTNNYGGSTHTWVGWDGGDAWRAVLKFDLASIVPSNVTVTNAYLTIAVDDGDGFGASVTAYAITQAWTEGTTTGTSGSNVSWNHYDGTGNDWTTPGGDFNASPMSNMVVIDDTDYWTFNLNASVVQGWINTSSSNHGMILRTGSESGGSHYVQIITKENGTPVLSPKLTIVYQAP